MATKTPFEDQDYSPRSRGEKRAPHPSVAGDAGAGKRSPVASQSRSRRALPQVSPSASRPSLDDQAQAAAERARPTSEHDRRAVLLKADWISDEWLRENDDGRPPLAREKHEVRNLSWWQVAFEEHCYEPWLTDDDERLGLKRRLLDGRDPLDGSQLDFAELIGDEVGFSSVGTPFREYVSKKMRAVMDLKHPKTGRRINGKSRYECGCQVGRRSGNSFYGGRQSGLSFSEPDAWLPPGTEAAKTECVSCEGRGQISDLRSSHSAQSAAVTDYLEADGWHIDDGPTGNPPGRPPALSDELEDVWSEEFVTAWCWECHGPSFPTQVHCDIATHATAERFSVRFKTVRNEPFVRDAYRGIDAFRQVLAQLHHHGWHGLGEVSQATLARALGKSRQTIGRDAAAPPLPKTAEVLNKQKENAVAVVVPTEPASNGTLPAERVRAHLDLLRVTVARNLDESMRHFAINSLKGEGTVSPAHAPRRNP